jgi:hypothetical protein
MTHEHRSFGDVGSMSDLPASVTRILIWDA